MAKRIELTSDVSSREEHVFEGDHGLRQSGKDADGDDQRGPVADAALGDLFTQPHQQHRDPWSAATWSGCGTTRSAIHDKGPSP